MNLFSDIPKEFYNSNNASLFQNCSLCEINVIESQQLYVIEKSIKRYPSVGAEEIIMEFVICIQCAMKMSESVSTESKQVLDQFQAEKLDIIMKQREIDNVEKYVKNQLNHCIFTQKHVSEIEEYNMYCHCMADKMLLDLSPMIVDTKVLLEVNEKLSRQTRDDLRGFKDKIIDLPPELKDLFKDRPILV